MNILIYGAGAVGLGLGSCLLKSSQHVDFLARPNTAEALRRHGLKRTGIFGEFHAAPGNFHAYTSAAEIRDVYDVILVAVKSFDSFNAAQDLSAHKALFHDGTKILLCQNGWGNAEIFSQFFPREKIYNMRVITGFTRPQPNEVVITVHADAVHIGSLFTSQVEDLDPLCRAISAAGIPCELTQEIGKDLWAKMLYNCALNPLGAVLGVAYGVLADHEETRAIMNSLIEEIYRVMPAAGHKTHWNTPAEYQAVFYGKLVPATAEHKSSTLQALRSGRRIEIDALTGIVLRLGEQHRIPTPVNGTIYRMIKFLQELNRRQPPA